MSEWKSVSFEARKSIDSIVARLNNKPAIYAFRLDISTLTNIVEYKPWYEEAKKICELPFGLRWDLNLGFYHSATFSSKNVFPPSFIKLESVKECVDRDPKFLVYANQILNSYSQILPPFYVGETQFLQKRIRAHMSDSSESLRYDLNQAGIPLENILLTFSYYEGELVLDEGNLAEDSQDEEDDSFNEDAFYGDAGVSKTKPSELLLLEEIVTRLTRPAFVQKLGGHPKKDIK